MQILGANAPNYDLSYGFLIFPVEILTTGLC